MKTCFRFFISKSFLINILIMAALSFLVLYITFASIKSYTGHGDEFSLPDFSGMTMQQASQIAKQKDLRFELMDSVFNRRKKRGSIIDQDPPAGFKVKKGRRVFLIINATQAEMISMPSVTDVSFKQAWMDIEANGLRVEKISYQSSNEHNLVIDQKYRGNSIKAGTKIEKGSGIELVLGRGEGNNTAYVPSLLGLNARNAKRKLLNAHLNVGATSYDRSTISSYEDSTRAFIWKHRPNVTVHRGIEAGSRINLWLTLDSSRIETDSTQLKQLDTLARFLDNDDFEPDDSLHQQLDSIY